MSRLGDINALQPSIFSGHKILLFILSISCIIYGTITKPESLIFSLYVIEVGHFNDLNLLMGSGVNEALPKCLQIEGEKDLFFEEY